MKRKMFLAAMLMAIGLQTSQAQFMRVWQNGKADTYDVTGSIMFTCAENLDWSAFSVYYRYFGLSVRPVVRKQ